MRAAHWLALIAVPPLLAFALPAQASENGTVVTHGFTHTEFFPDDICGLRASTATFTATMAQWKDVERADGTWSHRDVSVVTYEADYVDPSLRRCLGQAHRSQPLHLHTWRQLHRSQHLPRLRRGFEDLATAELQGRKG